MLLEAAVTPLHRDFADPDDVDVTAAVKGQRAAAPVWGAYGADIASRKCP